MDKLPVGLRHDPVGIFGNPRVRDHAMPEGSFPYPPKFVPICEELEGGGELRVQSYNSEA